MKKNFNTVPLDITQDEWLAALRDAQGDRSDRIPPGWLTVEGIATKFRVQRPRATIIAKTLVDAGRAEPKKFRVSTTSGLRSVMHYRLTPRKKHERKAQPEKTKAAARGSRRRD